jgi:hypothetical protein
MGKIKNGRDNNFRMWVYFDLKRVTLNE